MKLVIASPSPFARKARVALIEKAIPHDIVMDIPWNTDTAAPAHNPLGKIPVLILTDGSSIYDSRVIIQYLEATYPEPALLPADPLQRVSHHQVEALSDGICDAVVLLTVEGKRKAELQSRDWAARQHAKVDAGLREMARLLGENELFVGEDMGLADIAAGCALGYVSVRLIDLDWRRTYPALAAFSDRMEQRPSFQQTRPVPQQIAEIG